LKPHQDGFVILPSQYLAQAARGQAEPQKRLMLAVLQTVVDDCWGTAVRRRRAAASLDREAYRLAKDYIDSVDRAWPFSFENICEAVGLDAGALRRGLARGQVEYRPARLAVDAVADRERRARA
jgi:hypothetical protein